MKVLIVEDEKLAAERLEEMIRKYDTGITIAGPFDTVQETAQYLTHHNDIDVLFLDIQLADGKSFELFDQTPYFKPVIFTTAYDHYSIKAFKYNSIDYLLKPVRFEELTFALNKFKRYIYEKLPKYGSFLYIWMRKNLMKHQSMMCLLKVPTQKESRKAKTLK